MRAIREILAAYPDRCQIFSSVFKACSSMSSLGPLDAPVMPLPDRNVCMPSRTHTAGSLAAVTSALSGLDSWKRTPNSGSERRSSTSMREMTGQDEVLAAEGTASGSTLDTAHAPTRQIKLTTVIFRIARRPDVGQAASLPYRGLRRATA